MDRLVVTIGNFSFPVRIEWERCANTALAFLNRLPFTNQIAHVRWSGEAMWIPLGDMNFGVGAENATSYPAPGQFILYPGGISETELLVAYGSVCFASKAGQLAGNHFLTITDHLNTLEEIGRNSMWGGATSVQFTAHA